jgi:hypothetical protein
LYAHYTFAVRPLSIHKNAGYWIENTFQAAQMYEKMGDRPRHKEWLLKAAAFEAKTTEDVATLNLVKKRLELV